MKVISNTILFVSLRGARIKIVRECHTMVQLFWWNHPITANSPAAIGTRTPTHGLAST